jgi:imidazolonepropionase-like amidohydrolase
MATTPVRRRTLAGRQLLRILLYVLAVAVAAVAAGGAWYIATLYTVGEGPGEHLALTGATVLVGDALEPRRGHTVLLRQGTIVEVGAAVVIPPSATRMDLSGYTLLPGLMDLHVHLGAPELAADEKPGLLHTAGLVLESVRFVPGKRRALLAHGVTAVRCLGNDHAWVTELRQLLRDGELEGPRLFAAGPLFTAPGGHPVATLFADRPGETSGFVRLPGTPEDARGAVQALSTGDGRVDLIKVVQDRGRPGRSLQPIDPGVLRAIVVEAHQRGLPVVAHWGTLQDLEDVLAAGVDGLEHVGRVLEGWPAGVVGALVEREIPMTPTLGVMAVKLPPETMRELGRRVAEFHGAGGRVVVGSDAGMPGVAFGPGVHRELELLVESGLTPQQALRAATSEAARVLKASHIGAIASGRAADLVAVEGDPLQEIRAARNVVLVFRDGRLVVDRRGERGRP